MSTTQTRRRGPWKLSSFHGKETPQLFYLEEDRREYDDRAADPSCAAIHASPVAAAREGWSGAQIDAARKRRAADRRMLAAGCRATQPPDPDDWPAPPEHNVFTE